MLLRGHRLLNCLASLSVDKRRISVCCCKYKDYSGREAKFMNKLLSSKPGKKKFYQEDKTSRSVEAVISDPSSKRSTPRRVVVLNKLLMTSITDMLANGDDASNLAGRGMEVTGVSLNKDYQLVKVYWCAKSKEDELWLENELPKISHSLRHQLTQLNLLGNVPKIQFFLDKRSSRLAVIDFLISSSDKGPPDQLEETVSLSDDLPIMTHNVYGLQHDVILNNLMKSLNKSKAPHRHKNVTPLSDHCTPDVDVTSKYTQKESIRKFLLQRRLNREKLKAYRNSCLVEENIIDDSQLDDDDLNEEQSTYLYR